MGVVRSSDKLRVFKHPTKQPSGSIATSPGLTYKLHKPLITQAV